jgi:hypothetical protein
MYPSRQFWLSCLAVPLLAAAAAVAGPVDAGLRCSKSELPSRPPSLFFTGRATPVVADATVRGAGEWLEQRFDGSVPAYLFEVHQAGGTDAVHVAGGRVMVVPWAYSADCSPMKWRSEAWVEAGTTGLVYGQLRAPEYWVDGVPTIDMHNPYQLPYPRRMVRSIAPDDAFTLLSLLPQGSDLTSRGADALRPLWTWVSGRPDLAGAEPERMLRSLLSEIMYNDVRQLELEFGGTYRFQLELGDGTTRTFYGRTEAHAISPHREESGTAFLQELRPPRADGYTFVVAVALSEDELPGDRNAGSYRYMYADMQPQVQADGSLLWQAGAEWSLVARAFAGDDALVRLGHSDASGLRYFVEHNLPPGSDAWITMHPDGSVTFRQQYRLPGGASAVLHAERISTVTMASPRQAPAPGIR